MCNVNIWRDLAEQLAIKLRQKYEMFKKVRSENGKSLEDELEVLIKEYANKNIIRCYFVVDRDV